MQRSQHEKCPESVSGRHFWSVITTDDDAARGLERFVCENCRQEAVEEQGMINGE